MVVDPKISYYISSIYTAYTRCIVYADASFNFTAPSIDSLSIFNLDCKIFNSIRRGVSGWILGW